MSTENDPLSGEVKVSDQDGVRRIALCRPESKNGLTVPVNRRLIDLFEEAGRLDSVRAVLLCGEGGSFSSGLDLRAAMAMAQQGNGMTAVGEHLRAYFHGLIRAVRGLPKPVLAFIDGPAVGFGCDLALACDIRVGTARARFGEVFVKRGLMPDGGGTFTLPRLVGLSRALDLMMTGDVIEGPEAERIGLMSRLVADEAEARALAQRLADGPPRVLLHIKRGVHAALSGTLDEALDYEARGQIELLQSQDFAEGISAFFQKRPPHFTGR